MQWTLSLPGSVMSLSLLTAGCPADVAPGRFGSASPPPPAASEAETGQRTEGTLPEGLRQRPVPPGSKRFVEDRRRMVSSQIAWARDGREPVKSKAVLEAMRICPRHVFVPASMRRHAYEDTPLPIGHGQTISQPYIVAWMTEALDLEPDSKVLEVGTGSGYQAAVLAHLTERVYSIEIVEPLAERARATLKEQGYTEVKCRRGDGYNGWAEHAPFDRIIVTCAPEELPQPLWDQLKPGGRVIIPVGGVNEVQRLVLVEKTADGKKREKTLMAVRFVPLIRDLRGAGKDNGGER